jgi:hypothetical protein
VTAKAAVAGVTIPILEVTPEQLAAAPRIEHLLKPIGTRAAVFEYLSASEEPEVRAIFQLRQRLTEEQKNAVPIEAYALAVKISPKKLFGFIMQEVMDQSSKTVTMVAKLHHPAIIETTIKQAKKAAGVKDREMMHKALGFLPTPKNSVTVIHGDQNVNKNRVNLAVLPPLENVARDLTQRFIDLVPQKKESSHVRAGPSRTEN